MTRLLRLALLLFLLVGCQTNQAMAGPLRLRTPTRGLAGQIDSYTRTLGHDRRIWSAALNEKRDVNVYLPPGYDASRQYPLMIWLHGLYQDELSLPLDGLKDLDEAMASGRLAPMIIVIPDGTQYGQGLYRGDWTMFLNSKLGCFEDFVVRDVYDFALKHYPIRPDRQSHVIGGFSGGGAAAMRMAIRYRAQFGAAFALSSPLNVRWLDCHGNYFGNFDPNCWGWRNEVGRRDVVGRFYGVLTFRLQPFLTPLYGRGPETLSELIHNNPIEMLDLEGLPPGAVAMFVAYGKRDEFNTDAQSESFLYRARERGERVTASCDPRGHHTMMDARRQFPRLYDWLNTNLPPCLAP